MAEIPMFRCSKEKAMLKGPVLTLLGGMVVGVGGQGFVDQGWVVLGVGIAGVAGLLALLHILGVVVLQNDVVASGKSMSAVERAHASSVASLPVGCLEVRTAVVGCLEGRNRSPKSLAEIRYYQLHVCEIETAPGVTTEALAALIREGCVGRVNRTGEDQGKFYLR
jgi:hypothetical protein